MDLQLKKKKKVTFTVSFAEKLVTVFNLSWNARCLDFSNKTVKDAKKLFFFALMSQIPVQVVCHNCG